VTGQLDKAAQAYEAQIASYPRDNRALVGLGNVSAFQGQYQKAAEAYRQSIRLNPEFSAPYADLVNVQLAMQQYDGVRQVVRDAQSQKLDDYIFHSGLYALGFLNADRSAMAEQQTWFTGQHDAENIGLSLASDTEAYAGRLSRARDLTKQSVDSAIRADSRETGAIWLENAALREAAFGNAPSAKQAAAAGLQLSPGSQSVEVEAALAYALAGDAGRAESMSEDLNKRYPLDTQVQSLWLTTIRAQIALNRKNPDAALQSLRSASPMELGQIAFLTNVSCLYPTFIRGEAYLASGQGNLAAAEFQKILDHGGIVWNCLTGALARLGLARAYTLQVKIAQDATADAARARARAAYNDFLTLWADADPGIPVLIAAKSEYAKLQ
jgi:tetratricopeptide (TPR) repeat protein